MFFAFLTDNQEQEAKKHHGARATVVFIEPQIFADSNGADCNGISQA